MQAAISRDNATLLAGAAVAAVVGIMLGGAMQPQLAFEGRPMGPQMFAGGGGPRSTGSIDPGGSYATYSPNLPSYVVGTDSAQSAYVAAAPIADEQAAGNDPEPPPPDAAAYDEPPLPEVVYPSLAGSAVYDDETPAPPPPPEDEPLNITG